MPRPRFQPADQLPGATAFSGDDSVQGSLAMVELLKTQRWLWDPLRQACDLSVNWGRPREPGHWELAMVAFTVSGKVDIQPWLADTTAELWRACGFRGRPAYHHAWRRLRELEQCEEAIIDAIAALVQRARRFDARVGAHVHVDGTEDETHAALVHDCHPSSGCPYLRQPGAKRAGRATRPARASTGEARSRRQRANELDPTDPSIDADNPDSGRVELVRRGQRMIKRIKMGSCWYRSNDRDAGIRAYTGERGANRFWHGYYNQKGTDHFTGAVLYPGVYNASRQEYHQFPDLYEKLTRVIGQAPQTIMADKGQSVASVFELCTRNGTSPVIPWRQGNGNAVRHDEVTHDRHGIPRCKHCGGPSRFVRFSTATGAPRIGYRCLLGATPDCARDQSIACSQDWRLLIPLWRDDPLYFELRESSGSFEGVHDYWRDRYKVAADSLGNRPKAVGIGWHRLRALTACVVEWLRVCHREGWLGSPRRNSRHPRRPRHLVGIRIARDLTRSRVRNGLMAAYGPKAHALGIGRPEPPSHRQPPDAGG